MWPAVPRTSLRTGAAGVGLERSRAVRIPEQIDQHLDGRKRAARAQMEGDEVGEQPEVRPWPVELGRRPVAQQPRELRARARAEAGPRGRRAAARAAHAAGREVEARDLVAERRAAL